MSYHNKCCKIDNTNNPNNISNIINTNSSNIHTTTPRHDAHSLGDYH